jgi:hypothetical protein
MPEVERAFGGDAPGCIAAVPPGYSNPELVKADLAAGGSSGCLSRR